MEVSRFVKSYLHTAQLNRINIQMLKPLRMFPNKNEDDFLIISELKKKTRRWSHSHVSIGILTAHASCLDSPTTCQTVGAW